MGLELPLLGVLVEQESHARIFSLLLFLIQVEPIDHWVWVRILCPLPIQLSWRIFEVLLFKPFFQLLKIIFLKQLGNYAF
jgi:hypothetical protein